MYNYLGQCIQCKANDIDIVFDPCGHATMCSSCSNQHTECCGKAIENFFHFRKPGMYT